MKSIRIGIVTAKRSLMDRTWVKQDFDMLKELGFDVIFIDLTENPLRELRKIVSCHLLFGWFAYPNATFYARIFRKASILNAVGHEVAYYPEFNYGLSIKMYLRPFISLGLKFADEVISISRESAKWAEFWSKRKAEIIYEGINTDKFKPLKIPKSTYSHILLTVANLEKGIVIRKNLFTLIHAVKLVAEQIKDVKLVVVGEKQDGYPQLKSLVKRLGIENNVVFKGKISDEDLVYLYNTCDLFVAPSLHEGFPTVCCEALSCGRPVIASARPSMNEIFENGVHAILIDPKDHVKMAEAIINVIKDEELAKRLGKNGRELVIKNFSCVIRKEKLKKVIIEVLKKHNKDIGRLNMLFLIFCLVLIMFPPIALFFSAHVRTR